MHRRIGSTLSILICLAARLASGSSTRADDRTAVQAVVSVGITVEDLDRSLAFFTEVLDFEKLSEIEVAGRPFEQLTAVFGLRCRIARLRLGNEEIELTQYLAPSTGRPMPRDSRGNDLWFQHIAIITSDMDKAYQRLRTHKVRHASSGPQKLPEWNLNAAGIQAFYFLDPDGHFLEILQFPEGKGAPRWQDRTRLFLGIDHTAIVVSDTERSLGFYRDLLGMSIAGEGENFGDEQEHLSSVFGARLRITTLKAGAGPGIELLEYLAPKSGRLYPADAAAHDLFHWQTHCRSADVVSVQRSLARGGGRLVSSDVVHLLEEGLGFRQGFLTRDPDGHALLIRGD